MSCITAPTNGAPLFIVRNTNDKSRKEVKVEAISRPQHLPFVVLQTERGPEGFTYVGKNDRNKRYGDASFSETGMFTNHQTILSNRLNEATNVHGIYRVTNGAQAAIAISLVLKADAAIPTFSRDAQGKILLNEQGAPILVPGVVTEGFTAFWATTPIDAESAGNRTTSIVAIEGVDYTVYPWQDFLIADKGAFGNNVGITYSVPAQGINAAEVNKSRSFPYEFTLRERPDGTSTPINISNITGERSSTVSFNPSAVDGNGISLFADTVINDAYSNETDTRYPLRYAPFSKVHTYESEVNTALSIIRNAESTYLDANPSAVSALRGSNFTLPDGHHMMNVLTATDQLGVKYHTLIMDDRTVVAGTHTAIRLTNATTLYGTGGMDNPLSPWAYEEKVREILMRYRDCQNPVQDMARRKESIFYDTGFTDTTKLVMNAVITQRPDVNVVTCTHVDTIETKGFSLWSAAALAIGKTAPAEAINPDPAVWNNSAPRLSLAEEVGMSSRLLSSLRTVPESEYYGTQTDRGAILAGSGYMLNSQWKTLVPITMEIAYRAARYMGASDGKWKATERFSRGEDAVFKTMHDVSIPWVPAENRLRNWDAGINMVMSHDEVNVSMPGIQTVYPDPSSILNNWLHTLAISYLNKIAHTLWVKYRGEDRMEDGELVAAINDDFADEVDGIFDDRYLIIPDAQITERDDKRGNTWHIDVKFGASNGRNTEIVSITAYRRSDLEALGGNP